AEKMRGSCQSYCSQACIETDWQATCQYSKHTETSSYNAKFFYIPTTYLDFVDDGSFGHELENVMQSGFVPPGVCPPNEYGIERVVVHVSIPKHQHRVRQYDNSTVVVYDRRRSLLVRTGKGDVIRVQQERKGEPGYDKVARF